MHLIWLLWSGRSLGEGQRSLILHDITYTIEVFGSVVGIVGSTIFPTRLGKQNLCVNGDVRV